MGIWTGIKHAINSTLGTAEFKPLDKIIEGQRTLAASDSVIQVLSQTTEAVSDSREKFGEFIPKTQGSVRVITIYKNSSASNRTLYVYVVNEDSGNDVADAYLTVEGTGMNSLFVDVSVRAGVRYGVYVMSNNNTVVHSVKIGANIVDTSLVEVI